MKINRSLFILIVLALSFGLVGATLAAANSAADRSVFAEEGLSTDGADNLAAMILLVDDDDNTPDVLPFYEDALNALGYTYDVWNTDGTDNEPDLAVLNNYKAVIWFTGDAFDISTGPGAVSESMLASWLLNNNSCMFLSSQDYHDARNLTPFMTNYLGVESVGDDVGQTVVTGTNMYAGLGPYPLGYPFANFSDAFEPTFDAEVAFYGDAPPDPGPGQLSSPDGPLGNSYAGVSKSSFYQTTWLGFPLEALPVAARANTLDHFLTSCFSTSDILLVDDDDNSPDVLSTYASALDTMGYSYDIWNTENTDIEPDPATLSHYKAVVWFTGHEFGGFAGPGPAAEANLASWLESGGCMFLSSQDYYYDRGPTPTPFMADYLGLAGATSDVAQAIVTGTNAYAGLGPYTLNYPFSNYSDVFTPTYDAEILFYGDKSGGGSGPPQTLTMSPKGSAPIYQGPDAAPSAANGGVVAVGKSNNVYETAWLGYSWEAIPSGQERIRVLGRFLSQCFDADLAIEKSASATVVDIGEPFTYTLNVVNNGPFPAKNVIFIDYLPDSVIANPPTNSEICQIGDGNNLLCNFPMLEIGISATIIFTVTPTEAGRLTNSALVTNFGDDPVPENNFASLNTLVLDPAYTGPILDGVWPNSAPNTESTIVQLNGANFDPGAVVFVGGVPLPGTIVASEFQIEITLPAGFPTGMHKVVVVNPNDETDQILSAISVYDPAALTVDGIVPGNAPNDRPTTVSIFGSNFAPSMAISLKTGVHFNANSPEHDGQHHPAAAYILEGIYLVNEGHLRATVPLSLTPGVYDLELMNPEGFTATLPMVYEVVDGLIVDDIFAADFDIWLDPMGVHEGDMTNVGLTVRRRTGEQAPFAHMPVSVDVGLLISSSVLAEPLSYTVPGAVISPNNTISVTFPWTISIAGDYEIIASMAWASDTNPSNNTVARTILVPHLTDDLIPPQVDDFTINNGIPTTAQPDVHLLLNASDAGSSGLAHVFYVEYVFDRNLGDWLPVTYTGWMPFAPDTTDFLWGLQPVPGVHYIQVWVADRDGNVSVPAMGLVNYTPSRAELSHDDGHVYRLTLDGGETIQASLTSLTGDADILVWGPDGSLIAASISELPIDQVVFTALLPGTYQLDIYGHALSAYWFEITQLAPVAGPTGIDGHVKGFDEPLIVVDDDPGGDVNIPGPPVGYLIHLPAIIR